MNFRWSMDERENVEPPASTNGKLWLFRLSACGVSSLICLVMLWLFLDYRDKYMPIRLAASDPDSGVELIYDVDLGWRNRPHARTTSYGRPMTINSRGLRDRETTLAKPIGTKRILVLGDSFTWGYGVADDEAFTEILEHDLAQLATRWEVINTGVSGWGTDQEYLYLMQEGFDYQPDLVVLAFFLLNDPDDNSSSHAYARDKPVFLNAELELANHPVPKPSDGSVEIKTQIDSMDLTIAIVTKMAEACQARDCPLVVMKFGNYAFPDDVSQQALAVRFAAGIADLPGVTYLDLDDAFAARGITNTQLWEGSYWHHWNALGHLEAGHILGQFLREQQLVTDR